MSLPEGKPEHAPETASGDLFDHYARNYDEALNRSLAASGESREFFAEGRVSWLGRCLRELGESPRALLDFGCGDGSTAPLLLRILGARSVVGVDASGESLALARARHGSAAVVFETLADYRPSGRLDLAYCNGVFHHIAPAERAASLALIRASLRPGGLFALWENNPWNPATRYVMSQCAFDRDAQTIAPPRARDLLRRCGFEVLRTDFRFIFPRSLRALRAVEDFLCKAPLGTQYQVLARKPA